MNDSVDALSAALAHLSIRQGDSAEVIACFQEIPEELTSKSKLAAFVLKHSNSKLALVGTLSDGNDAGLRLCIVTSQGNLASAVLGHDRSQRILILKVTSANPKLGEFVVAGVHNADQRNIARTVTRNNLASKLRHELDERRAKSSKYIALGDFNADPYEQEVCGHMAGFFALRDRADLGPKTFQGYQYEAMFNPMWQLLRGSDFETVPRKTPPGTYNFNSEHLIPWRILDQILVSKDLAQHVIMEPKIVDELFAINNTKKVLFDYPRKKIFVSDHLPVELELTIS